MRISLALLAATCGVNQFSQTRSGGCFHLKCVRKKLFTRFKAIEQFIVQKTKNTTRSGKLSALDSVSSLVKLNGVVDNSMFAIF